MNSEQFSMFYFFFQNSTSSASHCCLCENKSWLQFSVFPPSSRHHSCSFPSSSQPVPLFHSILFIYSIHSHFYLFLFAHLLPSWIIIISYSRMNSALAAMYSQPTMLLSSKSVCGAYCPQGMHPLPFPCDLSSGWAE